MSTPSAVIRIFAGTNGAGKSSMIGAALTEGGGTYFNPDTAARRLLARDPSLGLTGANAKAWAEGRYQLERAIDEQHDYTLETTLGGNTIPALLEKAAATGLAVRLWYVGLASVELHLARVRARVATGGHDIPEEKIRERYDRSRENLIRLLPMLDALWLYDNSTERDPKSGAASEPLLVLHVEGRAIQQTCDLAAVPAWAKPIYTAALRAYSF